VANGTPFTIEQLETGPPIRFRCAGELDLAGAPTITEAVGGVTADVVLDVSDVSFLDSSGVGALIAQQTRLRSAGHRLRLVGLQAMPRRSLETLGLLDELT
jgi:anti-anti-sigma factor